ncbi:hypothetical protein KSS87_016787 [Heliosperma pusillum]|nr:hypothetical protein KSS87_016787 [Heliosperma pusillum]
MFCILYSKELWVKNQVFVLVANQREEKEEEEEEEMSRITLRARQMFIVRWDLGGHELHVSNHVWFVSTGRISLSMLRRFDSVTSYLDIGFSCFRWHLIGRQQSRSFTHTSRGRALRVLATSNVSPGRRRLGKEVIMVDPVEAKKLAAKQMEEIKAKEKLERRRQIEAINGAWAMIGLTLGLVIEGQTGKGVIGQSSFVCRSLLFKTELQDFIFLVAADWILGCSYRLISEVGAPLWSIASVLAFVDVSRRRLPLSLGITHSSDQS